MGAVDPALIDALTTALQRAQSGALSSVPSIPDDGLGYFEVDVDKNVWCLVAPGHFTTSTKVYSYLNGVLYQYVAKTVPLGTPCSAAPITSKGLNYCTFTGAISPSMVAQCN